MGFFGFLSAAQAPAKLDPREQLAAFHLNGGDNLVLVLEKMLTKTEERKVFQLFLLEEESPEMLPFVVAATIYTGQALQSARETGATAKLGKVKLTEAHVVNVAQVVYDKFVSPNAPDAVTVSSRNFRRTLQMMKTALSKKEVDADLFAAATKDVKGLLSREKLPRFSAKRREWLRHDDAIPKILAVCNQQADGTLVVIGMEEFIPGLERLGPRPEALAE
ncbi:hypothetical protein M885DRAFT_561052 [Pelagophyceae sp. CCMP2097]|nr:hypothetical protein M885DRAFT_561052 [Pelagophyceae sp. CCMP2097]